MYFNSGGTYVKLAIDSEDMIYFHVTHAGNMGARVDMVVDNFRNLFKYDDSVKISIKNEKGSPDYLYEADFYLV